jgi:hypothetical protein
LCISENPLTKILARPAHCWQPLSS